MKKLKKVTMLICSILIFNVLGIKAQCPSDFVSLQPGYSSTPCEKILNGEVCYINSSIITTSTGNIFYWSSSKVYNWKASHGTPFMSYENTSPWTYNKWGKDITMSATGDGKTGDGIYQNGLNIQQNKIYFLQYNYRVKNAKNTVVGGPAVPQIVSSVWTNTMSEFNAQFINLSPAFTSGTLSIIPNPAQSQTIQTLNNVIGNANYQTTTTCVKANANYDAIWFYPRLINSGKQSRIQIQSIKLWEVGAGNDVTINCSGTQTQIGTGCSDIPGAIYSWSPTTGLSNPNILNPTINPALVGNQIIYTLTVTVNGCSQTDNVVVTKNNPTVNLGADMNICANFMYTLNAGNPGATYNWTKDGVPLSQHTQTITTNLEGNYCVTVTNANGCSASDCIVLTYYPTKLATAFTQSYSCVNNNLQIQVTASGNGSSHSWEIFPSDAQGTILGSSLQSGSGASFTFNYGLLPDQYYSIKHIIYGFCGNFSTAYQTIYTDMPVLNSDFVLTLSTVQNGYYTATATMAALPTGAQFYWKVEEIDINGNTIPNTVMDNPSVWFTNPLICTFPQYCCFDVNNTPNGKFYPNHTYRITRGTWSGCNPWSDISYTFSKTLQRNGQYVEIISKSVDTKELLNKYETKNENSEILSIYPNPVDGIVNLMVTVDNDQKRVIQLTDVLGNVINEWVAENGSELPNTIDLTSLKKGIYFLKLISERNTLSKKIIKQ